MTKLSFTMENYLETIYELSGDGTGVRVSDIAERLCVTKASTNSAIATLSQMGLVSNEKYKEIFLTPSGHELAKLMANKHYIIEKFLLEILHVNPSIAAEDACAIEHIISNDSIAAMKKYLQLS